MSRRLRSALVMIGLAAAPLAAVQAHPHVWIDAKATLHFTEYGIERMDIDWLYDDFFSTLLIEEFDRDGDGAFTGQELTDLREQVLEPMIDFNYFAHVRMGPYGLRIDVVEAMTAGIEDHRVRIGFEVPVPKGFDPRKDDTSIGLYDDTYYVEVTLDPENAFTMVGEQAAGCSYALEQDENNPLYYGLYYPTIAKITCSGES